MPGAVCVVRIAANGLLVFKKTCDTDANLAWSKPLLVLSSWVWNAHMPLNCHSAKLRVPCRMDGPADLQLLNTSTLSGSQASMPHGSQANVTPSLSGASGRVAAATVPRSLGDSARRGVDELMMQALLVFCQLSVRPCNSGDDPSTSLVGRSKSGCTFAHASGVAQAVQGTRRRCARQGSASMNAMLHLKPDLLTG